MIIKVKTQYGEVETFYDKPCLEFEFCRGCQDKIIWVKTAKGKSMPVSLQKDGSFISHFANCKSAGNFRKPIYQNREMTSEDDRKLCKRCKREFKGFGFICKDCREDSFEDIL